MRKTLSALSLVIGILLADCGISGANIEVNGYVFGFEVQTQKSVREFNRDLLEVKGTLKKYPELKDIKVVLLRQKLKKVSGFYYRRTMYLSKDIENTMLHEYAHSVATPRIIKSFSKFMYNTKPVKSKSWYLDSEEDFAEAYRVYRNGGTKDTLFPGNDKEKMARFYKAWKIRGNSYEK